MIDIKRVHELAKPKSARGRLIAFLDRVEPFIRKVEPIMPELVAAMDAFHASHSKFRAVFPDEESLVESVFDYLWMESRVPISLDEYYRLEGHFIRAIEECTTHSEIIALRIKTRGHISEEQRELSGRLERVGKVFYRLCGFTLPPGGAIGCDLGKNGSDRRRRGRYRRLGPFSSLDAGS